MIVFGGSDGRLLNDVWELSLGASPVWSQLIPAGTPPSARSGQSAIYDPQGDRMVIFGGDDGRFVNDVWALSLASSLSWSKLSPAGTPPSARYSHTAIYDPVRDRMVMFGGPTVDGGGSLNDTWALSLTGSPSWSQLAPVGSLPSTRLGHSAIYDPVRDRMVVFAGYNGGYYNVYLNGVWDLRWTPGPPPPPGSDALTLDPAYPNPSRSDITVGFALPRAGAVTLRMYDVSGRIVRTLLDATLPPGPRTVHWDRRTSSGRLADPGVYFYELRVNGSRLAKRVVVLP